MNPCSPAAAIRRYILPCRRPAFLILTAILSLLIPELAFAHGQVGNRIFPSPITGNDAFPDNAASVTIRRSDYEFSLLPEGEKQLSEDSSLLITGGWARISPGAGGQATQGSTDLSIYFRHAVYKSPAHEVELTISPFLILPVGDRQIADQGYTHLGGEALVGKGLGDLPDSPSLKYLRPFAIQAEVGYAGRVQGPANSDIFSNFELEYSFEYLDRFVRPLEIGYPLEEVVPYVQINYAQSFIASRLTTKPDFRLIPGLAYLGHYCELSVGAQFAINGAAADGDRIAVIGLMEIFYDEVFPASGWNPW
jgi:hypothetical protein